MKLASESYELKSRAELCLLLGKLPSELTPDKISREEVFFLLRCNRNKEEERTKHILDELGFMLGTTWAVDTDKPKVDEIIKVKQNNVYLPLALSIAMSGMSPKNVTETIESMKKKAMQHNKGFVSADERANMLTKEQYLALFGGNNKQ